MILKLVQGLSDNDTKEVNIHGGGKSDCDNINVSSSNKLISQNVKRK